MALDTLIQKRRRGIQPVRGGRREGGGERQRCALRALAGARALPPLLNLGPVPLADLPSAPVTSALSAYSARPLTAGACPRGFVYPPRTPNNASSASLRVTLFTVPSGLASSLCQSCFTHWLFFRATATLATGILATWAYMGGAMYSCLSRHPQFLGKAT